MILSCDEYKPKINFYLAAEHLFPHLDNDYARGATRLTHAGLSIVEWAPIRGAIPPLSEKEWQRVFQAYQQFPEYKLINKGMLLLTLNSFFGWNLRIAF